MSALAPPSFIAPAQVSAPQGSTGADDATGFMSLLATCLENDAGHGKADDLMIVASAGDADELAPATAQPSPLIAMPVPVPVAVMAPVAPTPAPENQTIAAPESQDAAATEIPVAPGAPEPDPSSLLQNSGAQPDPSVMPEAAAASQSARQAALPVASAAPDPHAVVVDVEAPAPTAAVTDPATEIDAPPATADAKAATAAAAAVGVAPAQTALQPTPPTLRALAERTSRPLDAPVDKAAGASASGMGTTEAKDGVAARPVARSSPEGTTDPARAAPKPAADIVAGSDGPSIDAAPAGESVAASDTSTAQARETSLSGLSRATIDATAQIAAQILRKLEGRSTRFEMALTPDDLGRVDVKLDIDSEGRLAARLAFDNPAAATDLRGRVDDLRRELEDAGFHLAEDAFEFAERDSGSSGFDRGQDAREGQNRAFTAAARLNAEIDVAQPPRWMALSLSPAGVDLKV